MRVLLMSTPYPLEENPIPPLSLSYLAAVLRDAGVEVRILDHLVSMYSPDKLRRELAEFQPHMVGATCVTLNYPIAARIMKVCKNFDPGIITMLGGPHATFALEETLLRATWIDLIVVGEGERTLVELVNTLERGGDIRSVPGIAFRRDGQIVKTDPRPLIEDLDDLPFPARDLLHLSKYRALNTPCTIITSRGCPYKCIFCSGPRVFGRRVRYRNPKLVVDEIEQINKVFGFAKINIVDDTFTLNHRHAGAICAEIISRGLNINWNIFARADTVDMELLKLMKQAGCQWLLYGAESGNPEILKTIKKGTTPEIIERGTRLAAEAGINVFNSFIVGLPGETPQTARQSMDFAQMLDKKYGAKWGFHILSPLPGTELYERPKDYGLHVLSHNLAKYDANRPVTETAEMNPEKVLEFIGEYDRAVAYAMDDLQKRAAEGDAECAEMMRNKASVEFIWKLLKGDVIERTGLMKNGADPLMQLSRRVSNKMKVPIDIAEREMGRLVQAGLLTRQTMNGGFKWQWS